MYYLYFYMFILCICIFLYVYSLLSQLFLSKVDLYYHYFFFISSWEHINLELPVLISSQRSGLCGKKGMGLNQPFFVSLLSSELTIYFISVVFNFYVKGSSPCFIISNSFFPYLILFHSKPVISILVFFHFLYII